jgi:TatD DNase family protein
MWIETHSHLDAPEFDADRALVVQRAKNCGLFTMVVPAVQAVDFEKVRSMAHAYDVHYALGIHPLFTATAEPSDLDTLDHALNRYCDDPRCLAIGEIGLDYFVTGLDADKQHHFYKEQLKLAQKYQLPVILHVRKSIDTVLKHLRQHKIPGGIAHAFNGSDQQAHAFIDRGFKLGFGGSLTFERALRIRHLATTLPLHALVLETDSPDIPPHWLYVNAEQRALGKCTRNEPAQLPRIAQTLATLRGVSLDHLAQCTTHNASEALPKLRRFLQEKLALKPLP